MNTNHLQLLQDGQNSLVSLMEMLDVFQLQSKLSEMDDKISSPDLWADPKIAATLIKERQKISDTYELLMHAKDDLQLYGEIIGSSELGDQDCAQLIKLTGQLQSLLFREMMSDPLDNTAALISINQGAGGQESANWVSMLLRMYCRFADAHGFSVEMLDQKASEEHSAICLDSVSIRIAGDYAYGFFKGESGVHRLIRNSPFNAANARQTSFAAVFCEADIEDTIDVKINESDLEITCMRGSGSGGQSINKISSAVRMKHLPTGLIVNSRGTPSQTTNRRFAIKMMKAKLYEHEMKKKRAEQDQEVSQLSSVSFGSQIRSYIESPQALVKDHRSKHEVNDFHQVLNGEIKEFMLSYLRWNASNGK